MRKQKSRKSNKNKKPQILPSLHGIKETEVVKDLLKSPPMPKEEKIKTEENKI